MKLHYLTALMLVAALAGGIAAEEAAPTAAQTATALTTIMTDASDLLPDQSMTLIIPGNGTATNLTTIANADGSQTISGMVGVAAIKIV